MAARDSEAVAARTSRAVSATSGRSEKLAAERDGASAGQFKLFRAVALHARGIDDASMCQAVPVGRRR